MRYTDKLLADGERVLTRRRQHWLAWLIESRLGLLMWLLGVFLVVLLAWLKQPAGDPINNIVGGAALVLFAVGLLILLWRAVHWYAQDYAVTNRRLLKVEGVVNKRSADSSLEKINDAILTQGLLGRVLNYGDLQILTAADQEVDDYHMLDGPREFKIAMLNAKHALETEFARRPSVAPPVRAEVSAAVPPAAAESAPDMAPDGAPDEKASAPAPAATTPAADASGSAEITRTLARLADLRDRGAISAEEYDAKKAELLGRL